MINVRHFLNLITRQGENYVFWFNYDSNLKLGIRRIKKPKISLMDNLKKDNQYCWSIILDIFGYNLVGNFTLNQLISCISGLMPKIMLSDSYKLITNNNDEIKENNKSSYYNLLRRHYDSDI